MALQVVNSDLVGTGNQVELGTDDDVFVKAGVLIASTDGGSGVRGFGDGQQFHIEGAVAAGDVCIALAGTTSHAYLGGSSVLRSYASTAVQLQGAGHEIEMNGKVFGKAQGVYITAGDGSECAITNAGLIRSDGQGILVVTDDHVTIENSGMIAGGNAGIFVQGTSGGVTINNSGTIKGDDGIVNLSTGALVVDNSGIIRFGAELGAQSDTYDGTAGRITGTLVAGAGDDTIKGGAFAEFFQGDAGRDLIYGGGGADTFIYVEEGDSTLGAAGRDLIRDFSHKSHDIVDFSDLVGGDLDFVGKAKFSDTNQVRYEIVGKSTFVYVNLDADKTTELAIELTGKINFVEGDFAL